jgi:hypothetical protein
MMPRWSAERPESENNILCNTIIGKKRREREGTESYSQFSIIHLLGSVKQVDDPPSQENNNLGTPYELCRLNSEVRIHEDSRDICYQTYPLVSCVKVEAGPREQMEFRSTYRYHICNSTGSELYV